MVQKLPAWQVKEPPPSETSKGGIKDRYGGLSLLGVLLIVIGVFVLLAGLLAAIAIGTTPMVSTSTFGAVVREAPAAGVGLAVAGVSVVLAAVLIVLGNLVHLLIDMENNQRRNEALLRELVTKDREQSNAITKAM